MRIDTEQLASHLARGLKALYTIHGDEPLLALEAADGIRAEARRAGHLVRETLIVESDFDWSRLAQSGNSLSLFGDRRVVELRIPSGKPGQEGGAAIEAYCERLPADTVTLVLLPKLERQQMSAAWFGAIDRRGVVVSANAVERDALPAWIAGRLARQGQKANAETLQFLSDRVEGNLIAAWQEIQKLGLLYPQGSLAFDDVREAVLDVARYDIFDVSNAMLIGDAARLARVLDGLKGEGVAAPLVLWAIAEDIRALARVLSGRREGKPMAQCLRDARVWGPRQDGIQRAARRVRTADLEQALLDAAELDQTIKGLRDGDVWEDFLRLGLRIARASPDAPRKRPARA
jgi:DNA polymerase III subunit delta